jgi:hypothetical protein
MSCYTCTGCTATKDMNLCFDDVTFGAFPNGTVNLTFVSTVDDSVSTATGTAALGVLTITNENLPAFVHGVAYKVTSDAEWTLDSTVQDCVTIRFVLRKDKDGLIVTGTNEVVEVCS